jgi:hypothetical protein
MEEKLIIMMTAEKLIEILRANFEPDEVIAYTVIKKESVEDEAERYFTDDEWLSVADDLQEQISDAMVRLEFWETIKPIEEEEETD